MAHEKSNECLVFAKDEEQLSKAIVANDFERAFEIAKKSPSNAVKGRKQDMAEIKNHVYFKFNT